MERTKKKKKWPEKSKCVKIMAIVNGKSSYARQLRWKFRKKKLMHLFLIIIKNKLSGTFRNE